MKENPAWLVYILECADRTFYTGIARDLAQRLEKHTAGTGARYTRGRGPFKVRYTEARPTKGQALRREAEIKSLTRAAKMKLFPRARRGAQP